MVIGDIAMPGRTFWPDEDHYISEARSIAETGTFMARDFYRAFTMPVTGATYSIFYKIFGYTPAFYKASRAFNAFLHVLTAFGAASIAWSLFKNKKTALITLFSIIIYPNLLGYQTALQSETLFTCFQTWAFAFLFMWQPGDKKMFVITVLAFMLAIYTRPVTTVLLPFIIMARSLVSCRSIKESLRYVAAACVIYVVCLTPWWIRNYNVFGTFVPFTTSASWNLYLGNNPVNKTAAAAWYPDTVESDKVNAFLAVDDEIEQSRLFKEAAITFIKENKMTFLHNAYLKFKVFWNVMSNYKFTGKPGENFFLLYNILSLLSWGIALPLGLISVFINRDKWKIFLPIFMIVGYITLVHVVSIAMLRYRLPIEPFFVILGADCFTRIIEHFWGR